MPNREADNTIRLNDAVITVDDSSILVKDRDDLQAKKRYTLKISAFVNNLLSTINNSISTLSTQIGLKQDKASVATHSIIAGTASTSQIIRLNDQTLNSDISVDSLFSIAPIKDAAGKIILEQAARVITTTTVLAADDRTIICNNGATNITVTFPNPTTCIGREINISRYPGSTGSITINNAGTSSVQALAGTIGATTTIAALNSSGQSARFKAVTVGAVTSWLRIGM